MKRKFGVLIALLLLPTMLSACIISPWDDGYYRGGRHDGYHHGGHHHGGYDGHDGRGGRYDGRR